MVGSEKKLQSFQTRTYKKQFHCNDCSSTSPKWDVETKEPSEHAEVAADRRKSMILPALAAHGLLRRVRPASLLPANTGSLQGPAEGTVNGRSQVAKPARASANPRGSEMHAVEEGGRCRCVAQAKRRRSAAQCFSGPQDKETGLPFWKGKCEVRGSCGSQTPVLKSLTAGPGAGQPTSC